MPGRDPLFAPWVDASVGDPVLVRTIDGRASYWLVSVEREGRAIGFVRVSLAGKVAAAGVRYRDPRRLETAPTLVTGIDASEAAARAEAAVPGGDTVGEAIYVHDGPPGREAWMVRLRDASGAPRMVFVTPGGTYEHGAAAMPDTEGRADPTGR